MDGWEFLVCWCGFGTTDVYRVERTGRLSLTRQDCSGEQGVSGGQ